jgi:hypothetical protein
MASSIPPPGQPGTVPGNLPPQPGRELGRGVEGVVYEIPGEPGWVLKEFFKPGLQARNEHANLEAARQIRPGNVVNARPPIDPRQGWLVKEQVIPSTTPENLSEKAAVLQDFKNINDAASNLIWGTTSSDPVPRWILIE